VRGAGDNDQFLVAGQESVRSREKHYWRSAGGAERSMREPLHYGGKIAAREASE
jgi:hypothetical protein